MKATWLGEDGAPDFIDHHGFRFYAGQPVDVPEQIGMGKLLGNPFFELSGSAADLEAAKAARIRELEEDAARAQNEFDKAKSDLKKASTEDKADAAARVDEAQTSLNDAMSKLSNARK